MSKTYTIEYFLNQIGSPQGSGLFEGRRFIQLVKILTTLEDLKQYEDLKQDDDKKYHYEDIMSKGYTVDHPHLIISPDHITNYDIFMASYDLTCYSISRDSLHFKPALFYLLKRILTILDQI